MGEDLTHWNIEIMEFVGEAVMGFWFVDIFHFCEYILLFESILITDRCVVRFVPDWVPGLRYKFVCLPIK